MSDTWAGSGWLSSPGKPSFQVVSPWAPETLVRVCACMLAWPWEIKAFGLRSAPFWVIGMRKNVESMF